jgi:mono/diheme cytochrome c family protein
MRFPSAGLVAALFLATLPLHAAEPAQEAFFEAQVRPLLIKSCQRCHGPKKQESGLRVDSRTALMLGGSNGPALVSGKAAESLLIKAIQHQGELQMPPGKKLEAQQIAILTKWVEMGAPWPREAPGVVIRSGEITPAERQFWSFQPVRNPPLPHVKKRDWAKSPIDTFILARLEEAGIEPAPPVDRRTLLRRVTFDLTGLPPTPEEIEAFLADAAPEAFARVVDRLLAAPAYGERWGRHWLDVVRYADTAGETADYPVPEAYLYRNYVIDSFNHDKPYDQFLREQIAGDILARTAPREKYAEMVTATGYLALSRRFGFDPENYHHLTIADTIDTVGQSVLGLSLGCARCHHHKFDPVSMSDYYALYGIFDSTGYAFPGSEEKKRPRDFVPLVPAAEIKDMKKVPLAYAVVEGKPHNARIQKRGEPLQPGDEVPRRNLTILNGEPVPANSSGRLELARWLADPGNPLTARVMVNRIWQHHFGVGLVATENDFGTRGQRPSHPELLDYLAQSFVASGWSIKAMHRLIVLSRTYQLGLATPSPSDPENRLLGRRTPLRLEAEAIRDTLLCLSGNLDRTMGGPHPFPPVESWGFTQHNPFFAVYASNRRSVYLMTQRLKRHPFLALFDGPDTNASTGRRLPTIVPTQALFFLNDPFVHEQSLGLARKLRSGFADEKARLQRAYLITLGRPANDEEQQRDSAFLRKYRQLLERGGALTGQREEIAWAALARTLFARNEFLYID